MYEFDLTTFFIGLLIVVVGVIFMKWHQKIADEFGGGVGSYNRYRLWALITCSLGLLVMLNIPAFLLNLTLGDIFRR